MFSRIDSVIVSLLKKHGLKDYAESLDSIRTLEAYCGSNLPESLRGKIKGLYIKDGIFWIGVTANAAAQEVQLHKMDILSHLKTSHSDIKVSDLRCKVIPESKK